MGIVRSQFVEGCLREARTQPFTKKRAPQRAAGATQIPLRHRDIGKTPKRLSPRRLVSTRGSVQVREPTESSPNATLFVQTLFGPIAASHWRAKTYQFRVPFGRPRNESNPLRNCDWRVYARSGLAVDSEAFFSGEKNLTGWLTQSASATRQHRLTECQPGGLARAVFIAGRGQWSSTRSVA